LRSIPSGWRNNFNDAQFEEFRLGEENKKLQYRYQKGSFEFYIEDQTYPVKLIGADDKGIRAEIDGMQYQFHIAKNGNDYFVQNEEIGSLTLNQQERFPVKEAEKVAGGYNAPMPSQIVKVLVKEGQEVQSGDGLIIISSMKMENTIEAAADGTVEEIYATEGSNVEAGFLLLKLKDK